MEVTDDLVEKVARAIAVETLRREGLPMDDEGVEAMLYSDRFFTDARAALSAIEEAGWCVVPVEPTDEMYDAALASGFEGERRHLVKDYAAMLSARPRITGETT